MSTRLLLVRHARSVANEEGRWQGSSESALSALGLQQAQQLARHMQSSGMTADYLFCSPMQRAHQTAEALQSLCHTPLQRHAGLRERHLGILENKRYHEVLPADLADPYELPGGAEPWASFAERVFTTVDALLQELQGTIIIVTHAGPIGLLLARWIDGDTSVYQSYFEPMKNTSVSEFLFDKGVLRQAVRHCDACHLIAEPISSG